MLVELLTALITRIAPGRPQAITPEPGPAPPPAPARPPTRAGGAPPDLAGKRLRYLIAIEEQLAGEPDELVEVGYAGPRPTRALGVRYTNLFNQTKHYYGPYVAQTKTAHAYQELVPDWQGGGFRALLKDQCDSALADGFTLIEQDNPDGFPFAAVMFALDYAHARGLYVLGKNPNLLGDNCVRYLAHPSIVGAIVEQDAGRPAVLDIARRRAGKPELPIWFVSYGADQLPWARATAREARPGMFVSHSPRGEYATSNVIA